MTIIERTLWTIGITSLLFIVFRQRVTIARLRDRCNLWQRQSVANSRVGGSVTQISGDRLPGSPGRIKINTEDPR